MKFDGALCHATSRGNNRAVIFRNDTAYSAQIGQQANTKRVESGVNLDSSNLSAVKQAHKNDSAAIITHGKLDKERAGLDKEGWVLWIVKSGKTPRQGGVVQDIS